MDQNVLIILCVYLTQADHSYVLLSAMCFIAAADTAEGL